MYIHARIRKYVTGGLIEPPPPLIGLNMCSGSLLLCHLAPLPPCLLHCHLTTLLHRHLATLLAALPPPRNLFWNALWMGVASIELARNLSARAFATVGMREALHEKLRQPRNLAHQLHQNEAPNLSHLLAPLSPPGRAPGSRTSLWRACGIFGISHPHSNSGVVFRNLFLKSNGSQFSSNMDILVHGWVCSDSFHGGKPVKTKISKTYVHH